MTPLEGLRILFDSIQQTENTRGDYLLNKAHELTINPQNLFSDLFSLYEEMEKEVNTIDYHIWAEDDKGNRENLYKSIHVSSITKGSHTGTINKENIFIFLPGLEQFGKKIMDDLKNEQNTKEKQLLELLTREIERNDLKEPQFKLETDKLKEWILPDYLNTFTTIEQELLNKGYINYSYEWVKKKSELAEFLCVIINFKYFKPVVKGKRIKDFHKRQFISERYGFGKTGLSETWKNTNPKFDIAIIPFSWIEKPK